MRNGRRNLAGSGGERADALADRRGDGARRTPGDQVSHNQRDGQSHDENQAGRGQRARHLLGRQLNRLQSAVRHFCRFARDAIRCVRQAAGQLSDGEAAFLDFFHGGPIAGAGGPNRRQLIQVHLLFHQWLQSRDGVFERAEVSDGFTQTLDIACCLSLVVRDPQGIAKFDAILDQSQLHDPLLQFGNLNFFFQFGVQRLQLGSSHREAVLHELPGGRVQQGYL